jgi:hypothetical protein
MAAQALYSCPTDRIPQKRPAALFRVPFRLVGWVEVECVDQKVLEEQSEKPGGLST